MVHQARIEKLKRRRALAPEAPSSGTTQSPPFEGRNELMVPLARFSGDVQRKLRDGMTLSVEELQQDLQRYGRVVPTTSSGGTP